MNDARFKDYELPSDDEHVVRFVGQLLGSASSEQPGKARWGEISVYKTRSGTFIVAGVGRSRVPNEVDRSWVQVCEQPQGVIEKLHMIDEDGSRYIPHLNREVLNEACQADEELRDAYHVTVVD